VVPDPGLVTIDQNWYDHTPNFTVIGVSKPLGLEKDRKAHPNSAAHPSKKATAANIDVSIA